MHPRLRNKELQVLQTKARHMHPQGWGRGKNELSGGERVKMMEEVGMSKEEKERGRNEKRSKEET